MGKSDTIIGLAIGAGVVAAAVYAWGKLKDLNPLSGVSDSVANIKDAFSDLFSTANKDTTTGIIFGGQDINPVAQAAQYVDHTGQAGWAVIGYTSQGMPIWAQSTVNTDKIQNIRAQQYGYMGTGSVSDPYRTQEISGKKIGDTAIGGIYVEDKVQSIRSNGGSSGEIKGSSGSYMTASEQAKNMQTIQQIGAVQVRPGVYEKSGVDEMGRSYTRIIEV